MEVVHDIHICARDVCTQTQHTHTWHTYTHAQINLNKYNFKGKREKLIPSYIMNNFSESLIKNIKADRKKRVD